MLRAVEQAHDVSSERTIRQTGNLRVRAEGIVEPKPPHYSIAAWSYIDGWSNRSSSRAAHALHSRRTIRTCSRP